jgi:hypothetical protein
MRPVGAYWGHFAAKNAEISTNGSTRSESGGQPACRTRRRQLWLVASARAYVGFVRANVAEYDITEVCHRSRGRPVIRCPILV